PSAVPRAVSAGSTVPPVVSPPSPLPSALEPLVPPFLVSSTPNPTSNSALNLSPSSSSHSAPNPASSPPASAPSVDPEPAIVLDPKTLALAAEDVRRVMLAQDEQGQTLTTKLNILFVTNGALLTSVSISRLMAFPSRFSIVFNIIEVLSFLLSFTLLISAFFPRQVVVSPNLQDQKFLERYLPLDWEEYQLQMLVNLVETYNANRQRLDDVSQSLRYAAYATWIIAAVILCHMVVAYSFS
ncbi:MAG: hypothetical protein ACO4CG_14585, partial [Prochlorothrix sp.]